MSTEVWRSGQKMHAERRQQIVDLIGQGMTALAIGRQTGSGAATVLRIMREMGLESPHVTARRLRHEEIRQRADPLGKPYIEGRRLGYHWTTVARALGENNNG